MCRYSLHKHIRRHAQIPALRSLKPHSGETVHQSSLCRHELIIRTVAQSRLPTLSLMSAGSYRTKNSNLVIMNRVHSVTVSSHTRSVRRADGKGDGLLFFFCLSSLSSCTPRLRREVALLICFQRTLQLVLPYYYIVSGTCLADRCSFQLFTTSA